MKVSGLSKTGAGYGLRGWRIGSALLALAFVWGGWGADSLQAQQWRSRISSRVQYVEAQTLRLDSIPSSATSISNGRTVVGDTVVTCTTGADYCYFYRGGPVIHNSPTTLDADLNVFGFGVEGLRLYVNTRFMWNFGGTPDFWPLVNQNFQLLNAYLELNREVFRIRVGRDYNVSGLGFYGYDGGSALFRIKPARIELEAYGGWGLARGVPFPVNSSLFDPLGTFKPQDRNYLWGVRGSARPSVNSAIEFIYQRELPTTRSGIASERLAFEGSWYPIPAVSLLAHADYDIATGLWGKAGVTAGWEAHRMLYLEGGLFRYRPVFSLQEIWVAFSPVAYNAWNLSLGFKPLYNVWFKLWGERRQYGETQAEVSYFATTDRDWRVGAKAGWNIREFMGVPWDIEGGYWINYGFGAALSSGDLRVGIRPHEQLSLGLRFAAWQQLYEFRIDDGRVWGLGGDIRWRTRGGTIWFSMDGYDHHQANNAALVDWTQFRGALGFSYYLGSEPGRAP